MKAKILHIIDSLEVGGAEKLLVNIINGLQGYEQHVMVLRGADTLRPAINVPYCFLNLKCLSIRQVFFKVAKARSYIRDNKIDLVHSHLYESNLLARLATPRSVVLINSIHAVSSQASYTINRLSLYLEKATYKKRHVIIAVSKTVLDDFAKWVGLRGRHYVLYNFVDDKFFNPLPARYTQADSLKMVAVGNLRHQKNYPFLLEAFRNLPSQVQLDIYGQGDMKEALQKEINEHKLNVRLMGLSNAIEQVLPQYDLFVMSSFFEGQPLSLLEASACHVPCLLADIPVLREILQDDAIYFSIDDTKTFATAVQDIITGKHDLHELGNRAFERISSFARRSKYLDMLTSIYSEQLK